MRLTLRTLLAYLDKTLEPSDASLLKQKIDQAKVATTLTERISSVVGSSKLLPLRLDALGTAGDPNTVAEYLDNTLDPNIVLDFEHACLGDDSRLAEVAAVHQILASLGSISEPQDAEMILRIQQSVSSRIGSKTTISGNISTIKANPSPLFTKPSYAKATLVGYELSDETLENVPAYLKSTSSRDFSQRLTTVGLLVALIILGWLSIGPWENIRSLFKRNDFAASTKNSTAVDATHDPHRAAPAVKEQVEVPSDGSIANSDSSSSERPSAEPVIPQSGTDGMAGDELEKGLPSTQLSKPLPPTKSDPLRLNPNQELMPEDNNVGASTASVLQPSASIESRSSIFWRPENNSTPAAVVLALTMPNASDFFLRRVTVGEEMKPGERWIIPSGCRTDCWIEPGIRWTVADTSDLTLGKSISKNAAVARLRFGRALLAATPSCKELILEASENQASTIRFSDASGIAAVELRYEAEQGVGICQAIEQTVGQAKEQGVLIRGMMRPILSITCVAGDVEVVFDDVEPFAISIGQTRTWSWDGSSQSSPLQAMPWWFKGSPPGPIDGAVITNLNDSMTAWANAKQKDPPSLAERLMELSLDKPGLQSSIATQILLLCGEYSGLLGNYGILSEAATRPYRNLLLETLEQSLGADPSREIVLQNQIYEIDPARATRLLRLLGSPTDKELSDGEDRGLVDALGSPFLDERILGIHQLTKIVGKDLGYQSDRPSSDNLQTWKKLLNAGKIRWAKPKK